jgi:hypothetical protein
MGLRIVFAWTGLAACASLGCGSHGNSTTITLPSFSDVSAAPVPIRTAAQAVVRIRTADEYATGSFVSANGLLLTNNHVLGVAICPIEGCFAQITESYQRGVTPVSEPQTVFVVPVAVDVGLDMALVQAYTGPDRTQMFSSPNYLTISSRDPTALQGLHINVIGHPEGHLKKWSPGEIVDATGEWVDSSAYILPGNSGSPFLDDEGQMVGLVHRGPSEQDLITDEGLDEFSIGTASSAIAAAMAVTTLPAAMISTAASTTDDVVTEFDLVYLNAHTPMANVGGTPKPVLDSLGAACDAGLARTDYQSPEDLTAALTPCTDAELWINCATPVATDGSSACPDDASAWTTRYQSVFDHWVALNGSLQLEMITFAMQALSSSASQGAVTAAANLQAALAQQAPPMDFTIAFYMAAFGLDSYAGTTLLDYLEKYKSVPDYALQADAIAATALELNHPQIQNPDTGLLSADATLQILTALYGDPAIDLGTRLYIEEGLYDAGVLQ